MRTVDYSPGFEGLPQAATQVTHQWSNTYAVAEDEQHVGVLGVVCDLHQRDEGQVLVVETLSEIVGDKDARALASGHFSCQDHLQTSPTVRPMHVL